MEKAKSIPAPDLAMIKRRYLDSSAGDWTQNGYRVLIGNMPGCSADHCITFENWEDAHFVAHARRDIAALIQHIDALELNDRPKIDAGKNGFEQSLIDPSRFQDQVSRTITSLSLNNLYEQRLLKQIVLPDVEPDAEKERLIIAKILGNRSLGLLSVIAKLEPSPRHGNLVTIWHPIQESAEMLARILNEDGHVMRTIRALPDNQRILAWNYKFAIEFYDGRQR